MGLPVMNIHAPTVSIGSRADDDNAQDGQKPSVFDLMARKESLEAELSALGSVLSSHGVNMNTGLTTFDGFPRSDIDVAQIRTTRAQIIRLRNDHKALMTKIETALHDHFAANSSTTAVTPTSNVPDHGQAVTSSSSSSDNRPFAKVGSVVAHSPAESAGLKAGDIVTKFGDATWLNHEKLSKVAQLVSQSEGREIDVEVIRVASDNNVRLLLKLTPQRDWGGRGLLGCHLVPI